MMVLRYKIDPKYFLDEMSMQEVNAIIKYEFYAHKDGWEQSRLNAFMTAQVNSTKTLSMTELMPFYWEKESIKNDTIDEEEIKRLQENAKELTKIMNNTEED